MIGHLSNPDFTERAFVNHVVVDPPVKDAVIGIRKIMPYLLDAPHNDGIQRILRNRNKSI